MKLHLASSMTRILFILLLLPITASTLLAQPAKVYATVQQRKAFYQSLSTKHSSPVIQEIWRSDQENAFEQYVDGHTEEELVRAYGTVIHELLHGYNGIDFDSHAYLVAAGTSITVPMRKYFNSKELNGWLRQGVRDSVFRYGLYMGGSSTVAGLTTDVNRSADSEVMSMKRGIYGLVEEMDAYYHDNLAQYEVIGYYLSHYGAGDQEHFGAYLEKVELQSVAYYEFRQFIAWYLVYAKRKHPDVYQDLVDNRALREVFTRVDAGYRALLHKISALRVQYAGAYQPDALHLLDFSGSEDDFFQFCLLSGLPAEAIYKEESVVVGGKSVLRKRSVMEAEVAQEMRAAYRELVQEVKTAMPDPKMLFYGNAAAQITYLERLFTPDLQEEIERFRQ